MKNLTELINEPIMIETPRQALSFLRRVLLATAEEMKKEPSNYKAIRNATYRVNRFLADWEMQTALGTSSAFKTPYPKEDTKK